MLPSFNFLSPCSPAAFPADEPFTRKDIIHLQDPLNLSGRNLVRSLLCCCFCSNRLAVSQPAGRTRSTWRGATWCAAVHVLGPCFGLVDWAGPSSPPVKAGPAQPGRAQPGALQYLGLGRALGWLIGLGLLPHQLRQDPLNLSGHNLVRRWVLLCGWLVAQAVKALAEPVGSNKGATRARGQTRGSSSSC